MPPSRGLLAPANLCRVQHISRRPTSTPTQRQFSSRPSCRTSTKHARPSTPFASSHWIPPTRSQHLPSSARALSLWGWGSSKETAFADQHAPAAAILSTNPPTSASSPGALSSSQTTAASDSAVSPAATTPPVPDASTATIQSLDLENLTPSTPDLSTIPEGIGHFHALGLNYGWGPTSSIEWLLEHMHVWSGTPWWGSILLTAAVFRLGMVPLIIKQSDEMAKMSALKPELDKLREKQKSVTTPAETSQAIKETQDLMRSASMQMRWMWIPMSVQMVLGFCTFKFMRAAANIPVPGWETGGFLWLTDLTATDPLYITPFIFFGVMHIMARIGGESGAQTVTPAMKAIMRYVLPTVTGAFMFVMPIALQLSFITSMLFGLAQGLALRNPAVRKSLRLTPLYHYRPVTTQQVFGPVPPHVHDVPSPSGQGPSAPAATVTASATPKSPGNFLTEAYTDMKEGYTSVKKSLAEKTGTDTEKVLKSGRTKGFEQRAMAHERKRRTEIAMERKAR